MRKRNVAVAPKVRRLLAGLAVTSSVLVGAVVMPPTAATAAVPTCASAGLAVTALHGPSFYVDLGATPALTSAYAGYQVANNTGAALTDTWVELSGFTGGSVGLGSGQPAAEQIPALPGGGSKALFWYLTASAVSATAQTHTVTVYSHRPGLAGSTALCTTSGGFSSVSSTIAANANKITSVSLSSSTPQLGATFAITVNGNTGTIGSGPSSPADPQAFWMSPSGIAGWAAGAYRLVGTKLSISPDGTAAPQDFTDVLHLVNLGSAARDYTATYTFQATGFTSSNSTLLPVEQISSGTQVKHTGGYPSSIPAISPATNDLALALGATPSRLPTTGGTITYTATLAGTTGASLDSLNITAPTGATVVPGSSKYNATALPDPVSDGSGHLVLQGPFTLTSGVDTVSFQLSFGATPGVMQTAMTGTVGTATIDTTPNDLTDSVPATASVRVNSTPVAAADSATVAAGSSAVDIPVLANDTDADNDALTVTGVTPAGHGAVSASAGGVQYTPDSEYVGPDAFTYSISDGQGATATATVSVDVSNSVTTQVIDFPQPSDATIGSNATVYATADSGLPVSFSTQTPEVCTIGGASGVLALLGAGTCTIEASQAGDDAHAGATPVQRSFTVSREGQTITFPQPGSTDLDVVDPTVSALTDSGLPVAYASLTPGVCTVDPASGALVLLTSGTCEIEASQAGDATHAPATAVTRSFTIAEPAPAPQTINFPSIDDTALLAGTATAAAVSDSGLPVSYAATTPTTCAVDAVTGAITLLAAGDCTIQATQSGDSAFLPGDPVSRTFAILRSAQSVTFPQPADGRVGQTIGLSASSDAGLPITYSAGPPTVCAVDDGGTGVVLLGDGICALRADQGGTATYLPADATTSLAVSPALLAQAVTFPTVATTPVTATSVQAGAVASSGLAVSYNSLTPAVCATSSSGAITPRATGTCTIEADQAGDDTYAAAPASTMSFDIVRAGQTIDFPQPTDARITDTGVVLAATASSGLPVTYAATTPGVCSVADNGSVHLAGPGTCSVTAAQSGSEVYFPAVPVSRTLQIALLPQAITLTAPATEDVSIGSVLVLARSDADLPVTVSAGPSAVCVMTAAQTVSLLKSGTCALTATSTGDATHLAADPVHATIDVTAQVSDKTYTLPPATPASSAGGASTITVNVLAGALAGQTLVGVTQPRHGSVAIVHQRIQISVPPAYKGRETFTYTTKDDAGQFHTATVTIIVPDSPPTIRANDTATLAGTGRRLSVRIADPNHDRLAISVGAHPGARVVVAHNVVSVIPFRSYSGRLTVPLTVDDGDGGIAHTTVSILVSPRPTITATRRLVPTGTLVSWRRVATTGARYRVVVDGHPSCVTTRLSCVVGQPLGRRAAVTVTVQGRDRTASTPTRATPGARASVLSGTVYFATDSAALTPSQRQLARSVAAAMARNGFTGVTLVGYTDSRGARTYNLDLSRRRAQAVAVALHTRAVVSTRLDWHGAGGPAATNATARGRALNRRVEIWVTA